MIAPPLRPVEPITRIRVVRDAVAIFGSRAALVATAVLASVAATPPTLPKAAARLNKDTAKVRATACIGVYSDLMGLEAGRMNVNTFRSLVSER